MSFLRSASLAAGPRAALAASRGAASSARTFTSSVIRSSEKDPQLGDYPDMPWKSYQTRKWDKSWWDGQDKRNFGETVSVAGHAVPNVSIVARPDLWLSPGNIVRAMYLSAMSWELGRLSISTAAQSFVAT